MSPNRFGARPRWLRTVTAVLVGGLAVTLAACSSPAPAPYTVADVVVGSPELYVSLGDSYAAGQEATGKGEGGTTENGFAYQLTERAKANGRDVQLVNFGCSGATTTSLLQGDGCARQGLGPQGPSYDGQSQAQAAEDFIRANRSRIALVTVAVGGNDLLACPLDANSLTCFQGAVDTAGTNLDTLLAGLREATGTGVPIVGLTYPDVFLGGYLSDEAATRALSVATVQLFAQSFNPRLTRAYEAVGGTLVDVTALTGGYASMTQTRVVPPYGLLPEPVARLCELTTVCSYGDVHPTTEGYALIADGVLTALT